MCYRPIAALHHSDAKPVKKIAYQINSSTIFIYVYITLSDHPVTTDTVILLNSHTE